MGFSPELHRKNSLSPPDVDFDLQEEFDLDVQDQQDPFFSSPVLTYRQLMEGAYRSIERRTGFTQGKAKAFLFANVLSTDVGPGLIAVRIIWLFMPTEQGWLIVPTNVQSNNAGAGWVNADGLSQVETDLAGRVMQLNYDVLTDEYNTFPTWVRKYYPDSLLFLPDDDYYTDSNYRNSVKCGDWARVYSKWAELVNSASNPFNQIIQEQGFVEPALAPVIEGPPMPDVTIPAPVPVDFTHALPIGPLGPTQLQSSELTHPRAYFYDKDITLDGVRLQAKMPKTFSSWATQQMADIQQYSIGVVRIKSLAMIGFPEAGFSVSPAAYGIYHLFTVDQAFNAVNKGVLWASAPPINPVDYDRELMQLAFDYSALWLSPIYFWSLRTKRWEGSYPEH